MLVQVRRVHGSLLSFGLMGALAVTSVGCGGPDAKSPKALTVPNPFPTKDALESVARSPIKPRPARAVAAVPEWRVDTSDVPGSSPVEKLLVEHSAAAKDLAFTRELRCVARELGRFRADHRADPDERVQRFIAGACGRTTPWGVAAYHLTGDAPAEVSDEQLLQALKGQIALPPEFKGKPAGAWLTRKGKQAVLTIASGQDESGVTFSPGDTPGIVTVRGTASSDVEQVIALVNQGRDGVARCEPNPSVELPQFAFECRMRDDDSWAWIEVLKRSSGRILLRPAALLLARRDPRHPVELARGTASANAGSSQADVVGSVLEGVNRIRTSAKLGALTLAPKQADVNARLAAHFFDAEATADAHTTDVVALGLLAGWDIEGTIREGSFFGTMLSGAKEASSWVDYALEHPMGRFTLLEPGARQIAIGPTPLEGSGLGVVITTYSFFGAEDHQANATRVMNRLAQHRAARGLAPASAFGDVPGLVDEARLVHAGQREPMAALENALGTEAQRLGHPLRGWVVVTQNLDDMPFPKELLAPGPLAVRVVVTHYRPQGSAWGAYLVYFVSPAPAQQQVAAKKTLHASSAPLRSTR